MTFASTSLRQLDDARVLEGAVTAPGTAAPAALTVTEVTVEGSELVLRASTSIDRVAHGVTAA